MPSVTADSKNCWPFQLPFAFAAHNTFHSASLLKIYMSITKRTMYNTGIIRDMFRNAGHE